MRALLGLLLLAGCAPGPARGAPPPGHVTLTYLGVAGWSLTDGKHVILIDPYFSRPGREGPLVPDDAALAAHAPAHADVILVTHSHFDHLLDAPPLARRTGAQLVGSLSTARYARLAGVPDQQIIPVKGGEDYELDGFSVRVIPSLHSALDGKHLFFGADQVLPADAHLPLPASGFVEGGTFAYLVRLSGREILFIGSANYVERELEGLRPDVAVVATGAREEIHDYSCRLMRALGRPAHVLANHFDQWREPLGTPLPRDTRADLAAFADEIRACAPATLVVVPEPLRAMEL